MRLKSKIDANQQEIVMALEYYGASVLRLHRVGFNCPDILVGFRGVNYLMEIKNKRGKLTPGQQVFHKSWNGRACVVRSVDEALSAVGLTK